jgi:hypothetical protein
MVTSTRQSLIRSGLRAVEIAVAVAAVGTAVAASEPSPWPAFLPSRASLSVGVVAGVERVWRRPTLTRTVEGTPARVSLATYDAFVDAPDLTAEAARHLDLAKYDVRVMDDDWYEADDGGGAHGVYRVLVRTPTRRVILSWGHHSGAILGTITGSALTLLEFEDRGDEVGQKLTAYVLIDNRIAATLARSLVAVFSPVVDRRLSEGFRVTARVAEWATAKPDEFCSWLRDRQLDRRRSERVSAAAGCAAREAVTPSRP